MPNNEIFDAIVIGGGPSGIMAAGKAGERGRRTLLLEKNDLLGRKLLISGKGRCNITNAGDMDDYIQSFGDNGNFLRNAFSVIFNDELMDFFRARGVDLKVERGKRVFPKSDRSKDILRALCGYLKDSRVTVCLNSDVADVVCGDSAMKVILSDGREYTSSSVAVCTGGLSYPETGSTGFGFEIARKLRHRVIEPLPALVPLVTEEKPPRDWQGITLKNVEASVVADGRKAAKRFGDLIFTHFGLSGPIILDLSGDVNDLLRSKREVVISVSLKPKVDKNELEGRLFKLLSSQPNKVLKNACKALMPHRVADGFLEFCGLSPNKKVNQMTKSERRILLDRLTDLRFRIVETRPISEAIITRGGVDTKEINPKTMESKVVKNLFFAGEVIDVDAKTGGYNMQGAFSTGFVCGEHL
ncbi:MAG: NAD(P)/FAD-dependent oxidoreductase [Candidatus Omnitrophica bacterium]|nr:NAD(P)/FAD-dependent oxidoreductase [Candidatus Omnitrophota bacterium]